MKRAGVLACVVALGAAGALVVACSSDTFSAPTDGGTDGGGTDGGAADGASDVAPQTFCNPDTPFQTVTLVGDLNGVDIPDYHPSFTPDELRVVYARNTRPAPLDAGFSIPELWESTRTSVDAGWASPIRVAPLNSSSGASWDPTLTPDGLTVYFSSYRQGETQNLDILIATRPSLGAEFGPPQVVQPLVTIQEEASPYLLPGKAIYFARGPQGAANLVRVPFVGQNLGQEQVLTELNTAADERYPVVSQDELTIYFSRRPANATTDIMMARRSSTSDPWGPASVVTSLSVPVADDWPGWLSPDLCVMYFSSTRASNGDLYRAVRNK